MPGRQLEQLQRAIPRLHRWYRRHARDLPWRRSSDPYAIWVSEVMLQQTQVATVVPYYRRWLERFPTVAALAAADENAVLLQWEGLGYYSRARNLQRAARQVVQRHAGAVPRRADEFRALAGVGPYTAAAVLSIAFGEALAVLDGNVKRVLARLVALEAPVDRPAVVTALQSLAERLLRGSASVHNQAMMELGALVCSPRRPACPECPLRGVCAGRASGQPERYPLKTRRAKVPHHDLAVAVIERQGELLLYRRPYGGMLAGLWDLPARRFEPGGADTAAICASRLLQDTAGLTSEPIEALAPVRHAYTHLKVTLHPLRFSLPPGAGLAARAAEESELRWVAPAALADHPLPRATQKVLLPWRRGA